MKLDRKVTIQLRISMEMKKTLATIATSLDIMTDFKKRKGIRGVSTDTLTDTVHHHLLIIKKLCVKFDVGTDSFCFNNNKYRSFK
mmetsp:Transcript_2232/g.2528  ORF Transcript_2232/g.2528 Transcript_2232/m.2528 type:complete len:85 (-) Transcript_2232:797-1051(-)